MSIKSPQPEPTVARAVILDTEGIFWAIASAARQVIGPGLSAPTRANHLDALRSEHVSPTPPRAIRPPDQTCSDEEEMIIYYTGHGGLSKSKNINQGPQPVLVGKRPRELDNWLNILSKGLCELQRLASAERFTVVLDCCHAAPTLQHAQQEDLLPQSREFYATITLSAGSTAARSLTTTSAGAPRERLEPCAIWIHAFHRSDRDRTAVCEYWLIASSGRLHAFIQSRVPTIDDRGSYYFPAPLRRLTSSCSPTARARIGPERGIAAFLHRSPAPAEALHPSRALVRWQFCESTSPRAERFSRRSLYSILRDDDWQYEPLIAVHLAAQLPFGAGEDSLRNAALEQFDSLMLTSEQVDYEIAWNFVLVALLSESLLPDLPTLLNLLDHLFIQVDDWMRHLDEFPPGEEALKYRRRRCRAARSLLRLEALAKLDGLSASYKVKTGTDPGKPSP